jgi:arylsulfatase A-like enzyme
MNGGHMTIRGVLGRGTLGLAAAASLVWVSQDGRGSLGAQPSMDRRPNLVLITVDSLRRDHLGVYGYQRPTSPVIDAFAREAAVVSDAVAQAPYTKASIATLMTGLFPSTHKTYSTAAALEDLRASGSVGTDPVHETDVLSAEWPSLPVALKAAGYRTIGISANPYLIPDFGFANGFSSFTFVEGRNASYARADDVIDKAVQALAGTPQPFFLWVHLMDTHHPYDSPDPYRSMFPPLLPAHPIERASIPEFLSIDGSNDLNLYQARYDAGVRAADTAIGRLFNALRAGTQWTNTGIVLTSDHGEGFMEHGLMGHNNSLYNELLHVPLLVKLPGLRPGRVQATVQLADLFPTLAHVAGAAIPTRLHGSDILPVLRGTRDAEPYAYSELVGMRYALQSAKWKVIASFQGDRELFDLTRDPAEAANLGRVDREDGDRMERLLGRALSTAINDGDAVTRRTSLVPPVVRGGALGNIH